MKQKLNIKKIIEFKTSFWKRLAEKIKKWIWADMLGGKVQAYFGTGYQYSEAYAKYKKNNMRRFTKGEGKTFSDKEGYFFGKTYFQNKKAGFSKKTGYGTGKRLKGYEGAPIASNHTSSVNMLLTGGTIKGLAYSNSNKVGMVMAYKQKDAMKIIGNEEQGRDIRTLNNNNMNKVRSEFLKGLDENIREWAKKKLTITVGK